MGKRLVLPREAPAPDRRVDPCEDEPGRTRHWSFGQLRLSGGALPADRLFTGQTRDMGSDSFYFFKSRYYDATIGQFQVPDMVQPDLSKGPRYPATLNRYAYALNNPLRLVDPSGHAAADPSMFGGTQTFDEYVQSHGLVPNNQRIAVDENGYVLTNQPYPGQVAQLCTLVDAATILKYYGATGDPATLAVQMATQVGHLAVYPPDKTGTRPGPSLFAGDYVDVPGRGTEIDRTIEGEGHKAGLSSLRAQTEFEWSPGAHERLLFALGAGRPVILNVTYAPSSQVSSHSVIAYGLVVSNGELFVRVADPNWTVGQYGPYDVSHPTYLEPWYDVLLYTVTATYIDPGK